MLKLALRFAREERNQCQPNSQSAECVIKSHESHCTRGKKSIKQHDRFNTGLRAESVSKNEGTNIAYARVTKDTTNNDIQGSTASSYSGVEIFFGDGITL